MTIEVQQLRAYLRDPAHKVSSSDSIGRHRETLLNIWEYALRLTHGDAALALRTCKEGLRSDRQADETEEEYRRALDGIPSKVFGDAPTYAGVDKPQHFFATALVSFVSTFPGANNSSGQVSLGDVIVAAVIGEGVGRAYEIIDWARSATSNTGGYDVGDIFADDCGAAFGAALAGATNQGIDRVDVSRAPDLLGYLRSNGESANARRSPVVDAVSSFGEVDRPSPSFRASPQVEGQEFDQADADMTALNGASVAHTAPATGSSPAESLLFTPLDQVMSPWDSSAVTQGSDTALPPAMGGELDASRLVSVTEPDSTSSIDPSGSVLTSQELTTPDLAQSEPPPTHALPEYSIDPADQAGNGPDSTHTCVPRDSDF